MKTKYEYMDLGRLLDESTCQPSDPRRSFGKRLTAWLSMVAALCVCAVMLTAPGTYAASSVVSSGVEYWDSLPTELPLEQALPQHTVLLDKDGKEFARFFSENRVDVPLKDISEHFLKALISTEDSRFYEHSGVDPVGMLRALGANVAGGSRQGASTITQQLVQNVLINNARDEQEISVARGDTYIDKVREVRYAVALEETHSKDEILNAYANAVYFGNGAYGVQAAARIYFNTTADKLSIAQAATLVGMVKGPSLYDPVTNQELTQSRRNIVLGRMVTTEEISAKEGAQAKAEKLTLNRGTVPSGCAQSDYPYYCALVRDEILTDTAFGKTPEDRQDALTRGGMTLTTALDRKAMNVSANAVTGALGNDNRAALGTATIVPGTGKISAIAQNRTWGSGEGQTEIVYAASAFQPGSSMKPIVLATALEQGIPATTRLSASAFYTPANLDSPPGGFSNYGLIDWGVLDARGALRISSNTYFIRLIERTGVLPVADMAERLGIDTFPRSGPNAIKGREASLALGAYEATPIGMANAYSVFAGHGIKCEAHSITSGIRSDTGQKLAVTDPQCHQAVSAAVAHTVANALKEPLTPGGTLGPEGAVPGHDSGAKTGTTNDFGANWTVGITAKDSTAVWLGDPRGAAAYPLNQVYAYGQSFYNLTGSEVAAPVWKTIMSGLSAGTKNVPLPAADDAGTSTASGRIVPDVRGLKVDEALTVMIKNGLVPAINSETAKKNQLMSPDTVAEQAPAPGSTLSYQQAATLTLSHGSNTALTLPEGK